MSRQSQLYWEGTPVPYVAMWSSETAGYRVDLDRYVDNMRALFTVGAHGLGYPVWGLMNEQRQRQTVATRRCQVCNVKLRGQRSFGMDVPASMPMNGAVLPVLREPPACAACTRYALAHCPGNRRRHAAGVLECFEVLDYTPIATIMGRPTDGTPGTPEFEAVVGPGETCIGMLKCVLTRFHRLTMDQLATTLKVN